MGKSKKAKRRKGKWSSGQIRKKPSRSKLCRENSVTMNAAVIVDSLWSDPEFVEAALRRPVLSLEDISPILKGRQTIHISEIEGDEYMSQLETDEESNEQLSRDDDDEGEEEEEGTVSFTPSDCDSEEMEGHFPLITMMCRIGEDMEVGMFYLSSQEGNRLQLMRYNGSTFEPYDWNNLSKENIVKGCLVDESDSDCPTTVDDFDQSHTSSSSSLDSVDFTIQSEGLA